MNTITQIATAVALTVSFTASADYIGVSQFDGKNTWINTYSDVNNALGFSEVNTDFSYSCNCGGGTKVLGTATLDEAASFLGVNSSDLDTIASNIGSHTEGDITVSYANGVFTVTQSDGSGGSSMGASAIKTLPAATNAADLREGNQRMLDDMAKEFMDTPVVDLFDFFK